MSHTSCIVKVVNLTGKYEVIESSDTSRIAIGTFANSTHTASKAVDSTWIAQIRLTGKNSLKIDEISRFDISALSIVSSTATATVETIESESIIEESIESVIPVETTVIPEVIKPVSMILTSDMSQWSESDYYISPDAKMAFSMAYKMLQASPNESIKMEFTGGSGYGKTTIAERAAKYMGLDFVRIDCSTMRDTKDWFNYIEVHEKNGASITKYTTTEFSRAITRGNCIIVLDELNRVEANIHNSLFPLLDDSGKTTVNDIEFVVGPNVIFVATVNLGYQFGGIFGLDEALTNRFEFVINVGPMPFDQEIAVLEKRHNISYNDADQIVTLATTLRDNEFTCSTRDTLRIAKMVSAGMNLPHAFEFALVNRIPNNADSAPLRKALEDLINIKLGAPDRTYSF